MDYFQPFGIYFHQLNGRIEVITLNNPNYSQSKQPMDENQFINLPLFQEKQFTQLLINNANSNTENHIRDAQIKMMSLFQFKKLRMFVQNIPSHYFRIFDLQPDLEELEIYYQNSYNLNYLSDFLSSQDKIKKLKNLLISVTCSYSINQNIRGCYANFVCNNLNNLETMHLTFDVKTMFETIRQCSDIILQNNLKSHLKSLSLSFQSLSQQGADSFIQEEEQQLMLNKTQNNNNQFLTQFYQCCKETLETLSLYFAQSLFLMSTYEMIYETLSEHKDSLQNITICISQCRVNFDLIHLLKNIFMHKNLNKLDLTLNFCTQVYLSKQEEDIKIQDISKNLQELSLNLMYCPCSSDILKLMQFTQPKVLNINFTYINNLDHMIQNIQILTNWISNNTQLEDLTINITHTPKLDNQLQVKFIEAIINISDQLNKIKLIGFPSYLLNKNTLQIVSKVKQVQLKFENTSFINLKDNILQIDGYNNTIHFNQVESLVEFTKEYVNTFELFAFLNFENLNESIQENDTIKNELNNQNNISYKPIDKQNHGRIVKLIEPYTNLKNISIRLRNEINDSQDLDDLIQCIKKSDQIISFKIDLNKYIPKYNQMREIIEIAKNRYMIKKIQFFYSMYQFHQIISDRSSYFHRVIQSIRLLKQNKIQTFFRKDILIELINTFYDKEYNIK